MTWIGWYPLSLLPRPSTVVIVHPSQARTGQRHYQKSFENAVSASKTSSADYFFFSKACLSVRLFFGRVCPSIYQWIRPSVTLVGSPKSTCYFLFFDHFLDTSRCAKIEIMDHCLKLTELRDLGGSSRLFWTVTMQAPQPPSLHDTCAIYQNAFPVKKTTSNDMTSDHTACKWDGINYMIQVFEKVNGVVR